MILIEKLGHVDGVNTRDLLDDSYDGLELAISRRRRKARGGRNGLEEERSVHEG
jgi:hypothetical protein